LSERNTNIQEKFIDLTSVSLLRSIYRRCVKRVANNKFPKIEETHYAS